MSRIILIIACVSVCCVVNVMPGRAVSAQPISKTETFSALAYLPAGAGAGKTADVTITINSYSSPEEVQNLHAMLVDRGPDVVLKALEKMKPKGRISLTGTIGFFEWKVIASMPSPNGRRIMAAADRPISFLENYFAARSTDYRFGFMELDLNQQDRGEGSLIYAARVKVINSDKIEIENFGIEPVRLMGVRKL